IMRDYGLIFDTLTGNMYMNVDETGVPSATNYQVFPVSYANAWSGAAGVLTLVNFSWNTNAPVALTIVNGPAAINYTGTNIIASHTTEQTALPGMTAGIYGGNLTISGSGTLDASGSEAAGALPSYGIACGDLNYNGGSLVSRGATDAFKTDDFINHASACSWWANANNSDPGGQGLIYAAGAPAPYNTPYEYRAGEYKYVKLASGSFAVIDDVTVSGTMGTPLALQTATIKLYGATKNGSGLSASDVSGWFANLPAGISAAASCAANSDTLTVTFNGTPAEGSSSVFDITIPEGTLTGVTAPLNVAPNPKARFDIAGVYDLFVIAGKGGSVSGTESGRYTGGTPVNVVAAAAPGYYFTGWVVSGAGVKGGARANPATFSMPQDRVIMTANFAREVFKLTVVNGSGSGSYAPGKAVKITANDAPPGKAFDHWSSNNGGKFADAAAGITTFTMPSKNVTVEAVYIDAPVTQPFDTEKTGRAAGGSGASGAGSAGPSPAIAAGGAAVTGDYSNMAAWWASLAASAMCIFYIRIRRKCPAGANGEADPML
ncbi:MAG: hypothetical protein FWG03_06545, partial [Clostridiales bacterium]|nr:hypothetical protein [Clostridiales bacterium]